MARPVSFTCAECGWTSYNPTDVAEGYCGHCHGWTDELEAEARRFLRARLEERTTRSAPAP